MAREYYCLLCQLSQAALLVRSVNRDSFLFLKIWKQPWERSVLHINIFTTKYNAEGHFSPAWHEYYYPLGNMRVINQYRLQPFLSPKAWAWMWTFQCAWKQPDLGSGGLCAVESVLSGLPAVYRRGSQLKYLFWLHLQNLTKRKRCSLS